MNNDTRLIWEQFEHRASIQRQKRIYNESLIQEQYTSYLIEQILIEEGLMDTVKNAAGKVGGAIKNIGATVNSKMIQPIIQKAVDWLKQNDPDALVQIASAAQDGQGAVDQVISQQGGDQVEQEIANAPINEDFDAQYKEMLREHILYLHREGLLNKIGQGAGKLFNKAKQLPGAIKSGVQDVKQGFQQGVSGEQPPAAGGDQNKPAPAQPAAAGGDQNKPAPAQPAPAGGDQNQPAPAQPAAGGDQQGMMSKIIGWVKENPNMSKGIAMGIMGAASMAMGAAFLSVLGTAAAGYAIGGGMKGIPKYMELRKQGIEPMEALKQAGAAAHDSGMTGATIATGSQMVGNIANKLMSPGAAPAPAGAEQPAQAPAQPDQFTKITRNPDGSVRHYVGGDNGLRRGALSDIDDFEESILPRPGWVNKKVV